MDEIYTSPWMGVTGNIQAQYLCACEVPFVSIRHLVKFTRKWSLGACEVWTTNTENWIIVQLIMSRITQCVAYLQYENEKKSVAPMLAIIHDFLHDC